MKNFTIAELSASATASRLHISNNPAATHVAALTRLVDHILDPLRDAWRAPIRVNSGYRSTALNRAVGGTATSQHLRGEAADITAGSPDANRKLFSLAIKMQLPFDQLIDEKNYSWIHISYSPRHRRNILHLK